MTTTPAPPAARVSAPRYGYAVIPTAGTFDGGSRLTAASVHATAAAAAKAATAAYRQAMRPHGGSSGGYRAVRLGEPVATRRDATWQFGRDTDSLVLVKAGE